MCVQNCFLIAHRNTAIVIGMCSEKQKCLCDMSVKCQFCLTLPVWFTIYDLPHRLKFPFMIVYCNELEDRQVAHASYLNSMNLKTNIIQYIYYSNLNRPDHIFTTWLTFLEQRKNSARVILRCMPSANSNYMYVLYFFSKLDSPQYRS